MKGGKIAIRWMCENEMRVITAGLGVVLQAATFSVVCHVDCACILI